MLVHPQSLPPSGGTPAMPVASAGHAACHGRNSERRLPEISGEAASIAACDGIIDLLAAFFSVNSRLLRSSSRSAHDIARVRQIGMYVAHVTLGLRMADVAAGFSRKKSTVVHACHLIEDMREDIEFDRVVGRAEEIVSIAFSLGGLDGR